MRPSPVTSREDLASSALGRGPCCPPTEISAALETDSDRSVRGISDMEGEPLRGSTPVSNSKVAASGRGLVVRQEKRRMKVEFVLGVRPVARGLRAERPVVVRPPKSGTGHLLEHTTPAPERAADVVLSSLAPDPEHHRSPNLSLGHSSDRGQLLERRAPHRSPRLSFFASSAARASACARVYRISMSGRVQPATAMSPPSDPPAASQR